MVATLVQADKTGRKRALVIRLGRLGDTVMATPVIDLLRKSLGEDIAVDFAANPGASAELLKLDRRIDEVYPITHRKLPSAIHPVKMKLRKLSGQIPYDLVINLELGDKCDDFHEFIRFREYLDGR